MMIFLRRRFRTRCGGRSACRGNCGGKAVGEKYGGEAVYGKNCRGKKPVAGGLGGEAIGIVSPLKGALEEGEGSLKGAQKGRDGSEAVEKKYGGEAICGKNCRGEEPVAGGFGGESVGIVSPLKGALEEGEGGLKGAQKRRYGSEVVGKKYGGEAICGKNCRDEKPGAGGFGGEAIGIVSPLKGAPEKSEGGLKGPKGASDGGYSLHLTHEWPWEKIEPYQGSINAAMNKYAKRFPDDVCLQSVAQEIANGQTQLWLILKNETDFSAVSITKIETTHTGKKRVVLLDLAGEGGLDLVPLIQHLEDWARTLKADEMLTMGRIGWAKRLRRHGHTFNLIHYRKVFNR
ncbi:hypothetical protein [Bartonella bacilliformis]|uniref:hypothetical protein n=1 Tax=Bartonella bacilliformis TaxID=774 RepID=UPI00045131FA|nr:hypothetical protein X472_00745 [Bartonella bacilliformis San Pedro600-02]KEG23594.1 hypothetical protein H703_00205 [Bartonella bacilliformis Ver075]